ncbi:MAG TPA: putative colanic acid biosynthesis acetyltransferase [Opitutaceae bacterium]
MPPSVDEPPFLGRGCRSPYPRHEWLLRLLWLGVQSTLFRWSPRPLHPWRAWLLRCFGAQIGAPARTVIFPTAQVFFPWKLTLEPRAMVGPRVIIYNLAPVRLRFGANLSQGVHLCAGTHDFQRWEMPLVARPIDIGRNAWIAAEVFVGPGVTIGELSVVGARSVVTKDLPARMICAGQPCRPLKPRPEPV